MYKRMVQEIAERVNEDIQTCCIEVTSIAAKAMLYQSVNAKRQRLQELSKLKIQVTSSGTIECS